MMSSEEDISTKKTNKKQQDLVDLHLFQLGVNDLFSPGTPLQMDVSFLFVYFYAPHRVEIHIITRHIP